MSSMSFRTLSRTYRALALTTLAPLLACGDAPPASSQTAKPDEGSTKVIPLTPRPKKEPRKLIDPSTFEGTHATNLVLDPGFGLAGSSQGYGGFLGVYEESGSLATMTTRQDSRSPAGFTGAVGVVDPTGATDTKSKAILFLAPVLGGPGPFRADVWVSKTTVDGLPVGDLEVGPKGVTASIAADPNDNDAYDFDAAESIEAGGRTWLRLHADISKALPNGGFFIVRTGTGGGNFLLAAPSLVAAALTKEPTTRALVRTTSRHLTDAERSAIARYRAIPPQLTPAPAPAALGSNDHGQF